MGAAERRQVLIAAISFTCLRVQVFEEWQLDCK
jgi:hypothetical protein